LYRLAYLAPDPIPESLLEVPVPNSEDDPLTARDALTELDAYSLACLSTEVESPSFTIHRLVQVVTRRSLQDDSSHTHLTAALAWIADAFIGDPHDVRCWPTLDPLAKHAKSVADFADQVEIAERTARLMNHLGILQLSKAQHAQAEPLMRRALEIDEQSYGKEHPNVASSLNNLATLLQDTNRLAEAEPLMQRVVEIDEQSYGKEHPQVAIPLNNLAQLLQATNRLAEAEPLMRRALEIDEHSYGPEHPQVAIPLSNLGEILRMLNRLDEAEPLLRRALQIDIDALGEDHPDVAIDGYKLALVEHGKNNTAEAWRLLEHSLAVFRASFGDDSHPRIQETFRRMREIGMEPPR
jgi:tetratricopeptide (TPR) repeat protein